MYHHIALGAVGKKSHVTWSYKQSVRAYGKHVDRLDQIIHVKLGFVHGLRAFRTNHKKYYPFETASHAASEQCRAASRFSKNTSRRSSLSARKRPACALRSTLQFHLIFEQLVLGGPREGRGTARPAGEATCCNSVSKAAALDSEAAEQEQGTGQLKGELLSGLLQLGF